MDLKEEYKRFFGTILQDINIEECTVTPACAQGENYVADVHRVQIVGELLGRRPRKDCSQSFIVKKIPEDEAPQRKIHNYEKLFGNEELAYSVIFPELEQLLQQKQSRIELPFSRYYGRWPSYIVLEDLMKMGYNTLDRTRGFDLEQSSLILEKLSSFHATSLVLKATNPDRLQKVTEKIQSMYEMDKPDELLTVIWEKALNKAIQCLEDGPEELHKVAELVQPYCGSVLAKMLQLTKPYQQFSVICHGDLWASNIMFKSENLKYVDVKLVDLQCVRYSSCMIDVLHLFCTSTRPGLLSKHFHTLIGHYHAELSRHTKQLGGHVPFSVQDLVEESRRVILYGLFLSFIMLPCLTGSGPGPQEQTCDERLRRLVTDLVYLGLIR